ncbi:MAG: metalloregulator ArsR/SmtB family transcription factor [Actinomycetes bacterium]|jgi:DNA-binding transcriptional ArsR family regulator
MPDLLELVAEPQRRRLLQLLAKGEKTVSEISDAFPVSRSAISQQLLLLEEAGLVSARKVGRNRIYQIESGGMAKLHQFFLDQFWQNEVELLLLDAQQVMPKRKKGVR